MAISWVAKKKITYLGGLLLIILIPLALTVWAKWPKPSCTDAKLNQQEEGVDCGGPCTPCIAKPVDLVVHWVKPFKISEGKYDVAALIENPNQSYAIKNLEYQFKVYDSKNILISQIKGSTFVNPREKFLIFEPNIETGFREPTKAFIDLPESYGNGWSYLEKEKSGISVLSKKFTNEPFARLEVVIKNNTLRDVSELVAGGVLFDKNNNAFASSVTKVGTLAGGGTQSAIFTWPKSFAEAPTLDEVYFRVDLTK